MLRRAAIAAVAQHALHERREEIETVPVLGEGLARPRVAARQERGEALGPGVALRELDDDVVPTDEELRIVRVAAVAAKLPGDQEQRQAADGHVRSEMPRHEVEEGGEVARPRRLLGGAKPRPQGFAARGEAVGGRERVEDAEARVVHQLDARVRIGHQRRQAAFRDGQQREQGIEVEAGSPAEATEGVRARHGIVARFGKRVDEGDFPAVERAELRRRALRRGHVALALGRGEAADRHALEPEDLQDPRLEGMKADPQTPGGVQDLAVVKREAGAAPA